MSIGVQPMFSRKRSETEDRKMADSHNDPRISMTSPRPAGATTPALVRPLAMPPRTPELARAADPLRPADSLLGRPSELSDQSKPDGEMRRLSVGRGITLSGEINTCQKLFIEGTVEATLTNCCALDIAESDAYEN